MCHGSPASDEAVSTPLPARLHAGLRSLHPVVEAAAAAAASGTQQGSTTAGSPAASPAACWLPKSARRLKTEALLAARHTAAAQQSASSPWGAAISFSNSLQRISSTASDLDSRRPAKRRIILADGAMATSAPNAACIHSGSEDAEPQSRLAPSDDEQQQGVQGFALQSVQVPVCLPSAVCCSAGAAPHAANGAAASESAADEGNSRHPVASSEEGTESAMAAAAAPSLLPPAGGRANAPRWTGFDVAVPHIDWAALLAAMTRAAGSQVRDPGAEPVASATVLMGPIQVKTPKDEDTFLVQADCGKTMLNLQAVFKLACRPV